MWLGDTEKFLHFYRFLYRQFDEVNYFTVLSTAEREADQASSGCGIVLVTKDHKGSCQKRFSGFCLLREGGGTPLSAKLF